MGKTLPSRNTIGFVGGFGSSPSAPMTMNVCPAFGPIFFHEESSFVAEISMNYKQKAAELP